MEHIYIIHVYIDRAELWVDGEWSVIKPTHSFDEGYAWAAKWYPDVEVK